MSKCDLITAFKKLPARLCFELENCYYRKNDIPCDRWESFDGMGTAADRKVMSLLKSLDDDDEP